MKKLMLLLVCLLAVGCGSEINKAQIENAEALCNANEGVFQIHVKMGSYPLWAYSVSCNNGAKFITSTEK